jgi:hypothetical protein
MIFSTLPPARVVGSAPTNLVAAVWLAYWTFVRGSIRRVCGKKYPPPASSVRCDAREARGVSGGLLQRVGELVGWTRDRRGG